MSEKIDIKTSDQIKIMQEGGKILADVVWELMDNLRPGISEIELDKVAEKLIIAKGAEPGFKRVPGYHHSVCMSTNEVVVHGIPGEHVLNKGDVVGIDCGVFYKGFNTDMSETRIVGGKSTPQIENFLDVGKSALDNAIREAQVGNRIGNISKKIQDIVEGGGYSVVKSLIGHGVGRELHEAPEVPGYLVPGERIEDTPLLVEGMTIAIEVIYNMGTDQVSLEDDDWTISTSDGKISGLFERSVAITRNGPLLLTS